MSNAIVTTHQSQPMATRASTDDQLIDLWLRQKNSERTRKTYRIAVADFETFTGRIPLREIKVDELVGYREYLREKYSSAHTRKLKLNAVKSLLTFAAKTGYIPFNVGAAVDADKAETVLEDKILSESEIFGLLAATEGRDNILIRLLYASAGRVSEIAALTWGDVKGGYIIIREGKGGKMRRVTLSDDTAAALEEFRPAGATDDAPVFTARGKDTALTDNAIYRQIRRIGERNGLEKLHPHMFRHSHASHALKRGADVALVRDTLGHSSIAVTNTYLHAGKGESSALHLAV